MKTTKRFAMLAMALFATLTLAAQRQAQTFKGYISDFPYGGNAPATLHIAANGDYKLTVEKGETVTGFTMEGKIPEPFLDMPVGGGKGPSAEGFNWAFPISTWTEFQNQGNTFRPAGTPVKGTLMGQTGEKNIKLRIALQSLLPSGNGQTFTMTLECVLQR